MSHRATRKLSRANKLRPKFEASRLDRQEKKVVAYALKRAADAEVGA